jgi:catechol 2,3-dioxygenase-like lactoylglutathione lyase family enzyme
MRLHHVGIPIPFGSEERALEFYARIPGFRNIPKPPDLHRDGGLWFELEDGRQLHLQIDIPLPAESRTHPAFLVDDLDALAKELTVPVEWDETWIGTRRFKIHDPFRNTLEFIDAAQTTHPLP